MLEGARIGPEIFKKKTRQSGVFLPYAISKKSNLKHKTGLPEIGSPVEINALVD